MRAFDEPLWGACMGSCSAGLHTRKFTSSGANYLCRAQVPLHSKYARNCHTGRRPCNNETTQTTDSAREHQYSQGVPGPLLPSVVVENSSSCKKDEQSNEPILPDSTAFRSGLLRAMETVLISRHGVEITAVSASPNCDRRTVLMCSILPLNAIVLRNESAPGGRRGSLAAWHCGSSGSVCRDSQVRRDFADWLVFNCTAS
mmetsp:Transcript_11985/g.36505  ORF Transcript_11985/g.36505 Transcript_11985/m.36505 type:complete len:201 (+) Transcript_11985:1478-2080(+)